MGMSIDKAIEHGKEQLEIFGGEHKEFIECAIDIMRKYQKLQVDYETRLKADMVAMLEEISLEIDEMDCTIDHDFEGYYTGHVDCQKLIREKINSLKEKNNES